MSTGVSTRTRIWLRWVAYHAAPRAFLTMRARQGDPLARIMVGRNRCAELYPMIERVRADGRLVRTRYFTVTADHELCRTILRDNRFGVLTPENMDMGRPIRWILTKTDPGLPNPVEPPAMVAVDPPEHTEYRRPIASAFTPRAIAKLNDRIVEVTDQLLDQLAELPRPDLIADFACRLPVAIIAEILGVPDEDHDMLLSWGHSGAPLLDLGLSWRTYREAIAILVDGDNYFDRHIDRLSADPDSSILSHLAEKRELGRRELSANSSLLLGAGFETTVNLIGNGIVHLLAHPEQLALLRDEPDRWPNAVEEILRYESPVQMTVRRVNSDLELAGQHLPAGTTLVLLLGGANRDPAAFDDPNRFDITRANARDHLAFGSGIHACLGAALARTEGATALRALFERYPDLRLDGAPVRRDLVTLHGYQRLPAKLAVPVAH
ncbi:MULTISPECIES: cytochrome P450 [unclassified Nocardia]|uniref:cytochrome P450 n=1 Tax=unclassified Nocardia TaxID=2637762 RepID=UPI001CE42FBE|nr:MULTISPECIES: cytochrome P450 [unclassified Nocardia]